MQIDAQKQVSIELLAMEVGLILEALDDQKGRVTRKVANKIEQQLALCINKEE